jgi:hypothetical protein
MKEYNKRISMIMANHNAMSIACDEEKETLNQEIIELKKQIKIKQAELRRKRIHNSNNDIDLNEDFYELENKINLLDEKIKKYNS